MNYCTRSNSVVVMPPARPKSFEWIVKALYDLDDCEPDNFQVSDLPSVVEYVTEYLQTNTIQESSPRVLALVIFVQKYVDRFLTRLNRNDDEYDEIMAERRRINKALRKIDTEIGVVKPKKAKRSDATFDLNIPEPPSPVATTVSSNGPSNLMPDAIPAMIPIEDTHPLFGDENEISEKLAELSGLGLATSIVDDVTLYDNDHGPLPDDHPESLIESKTLSKIEPQRIEESKLDESLAFESMFDKNMPVKDIVKRIQRIEQNRIALGEKEAVVESSEPSEESSIEPPVQPQARPRPRPRARRADNEVQADQNLVANIYRNLPVRERQLRRPLIYGWDVEEPINVELYLPNFPIPAEFLSLFTDNCVIFDPSEQPAMAEEAESGNEPIEMALPAPSDADLTHDVPNDKTAPISPPSFGDEISADLPGIDVSEQAADSSNVPLQSISALPEPVFEGLSEMESLRVQQSVSVAEDTVASRLALAEESIRDSLPVFESDDEQSSQERLRRAKQFHDKLLHQLGEHESCTFWDMTKGTSKLEALFAMEDMVHLFELGKILCTQIEYLGDIYISLP